MKKSLIGILALLFLAQAQDNLTGRQIMEKARDAQTLSGTEYVGTLIIYDKKGNERTRKIAAASRDYPEEAVSKRIIRFLEPADVKGTAMLIFDYDDRDDDMWIYMPSLRKTRRIVSSDKGKSFMGSEFSNSDMAAENMEEFTYNLQGEESFKETDCWKIEVLPVDETVAEENGFSRKITWIGKNDFVMRHALFYDLFEELHKEQTNSDVRLLDAAGQKYQAAEMIMVNVQNGRQSIMRMDQVLFNPNVKDEYFTTRYLEKQ